MIVIIASRFPGCYCIEKRGDNEEEGMSLGLARAHALRALFPDVPEDRVRYAARSINKEEEGVRTNYFAAHSFNSEI